MLEPTQVRRSRAGETSSPWGMQPLISLTLIGSPCHQLRLSYSAPHALWRQRLNSPFLAREKYQHEMPSQFRFGVQQPGEVGEFEMVRLWDFRRAVAAERLEDTGPTNQFVDR